MRVQGGHSSVQPAKKAKRHSEFKAWPPTLMPPPPPPVPLSTYCYLRPSAVAMSYNTDVFLSVGGIGTAASSAGRVWDITA